MQVLFVIVAVGLCIASAALVTDLLLRLLLHLSFRRMGAKRPMMPGRVEIPMQPQGIWHRDRV